MKSLKAVIFDMDGVLVNSMNYHVSSWKDAFGLIDIQPSRLELLLLEGMPARETIDVVAKRYNTGVSDEEREHIVEKKIESFCQIFRLDIYSGIYPFLEQLRKEGLILSVVTGSHKDAALKLIEENFSGMFDVVVTGEDVIHGKPSPEPYLKALNMLDIKSSDAVVVENAPLGIQSAQSAGLEVYAIETTLGREHLYEAREIFRDHSELIRHMQGRMNIASS